MASPQGAHRRSRSPFAAAFLSLLFPGLGHAYAGAYPRALGFAAPPVLLVALLGGLGLRLPRGELYGFVLSNLGPILIADILLFAYRLAAIVDAWQVVNHLNALERSDDGRLGTPRIRWNPASIAALLAVVLVMSGAHVAVARYDLAAQSLVDCVFDPGGTASCEEATGSPEPSPSDGPSPAPTASPDAIAAPSPLGTPMPDVTLPPWDGKERLNILLIGTDQRPREGSYNTDTLIVVSVDPTTRQVAMFSLPRDTVDVPVPSGPARSLWGTVYRGKINSWFMQNRGRADLWPGNDRTRGYNALKAILGELYGLDIRWFVEVNFDGFKKVVDALGGVTINVQVPISDDRYPGDDGRLLRVYIPTGIQHMTGSQALIYARSRHSSSDFDRGQRQQRVLLSLGAQTEVGEILPRLDQLIAALKTAVRTDVPIGELPRLLGLAEGIDLKSVRSYVFAPPLYGIEGYEDGLYFLRPRVDAIRAAVKGAFKLDPAAEAQRQALAQEGASVWVLNGAGIPGQASDIAAWLESQGVAASAPNQRPDQRGLAKTLIRVYNGAETRLPLTITFLEAAFGVTVKPVADAAARVDIAIITARTTPDYTPPPAP
jgi:LCP family protein required for cell wall assembly